VWKAPPVLGAAAFRQPAAVASLVSSSMAALREHGVRSAQEMQAGPCTPVETQLEKAEVGPTSGPAWRLPHLVARADEALREELVGDLSWDVGTRHY
jgi:hypothetical protein